VELDEWNEFQDHRAYFERQGSNICTTVRQASFDEPYWSTNGIEFYVIGPHQRLVESETRELHDASLVILANMGNRSCLFAGDASDILLRQIASTTTGFCSDILHASHHGSLHGADLEFIKKCNAQYTVISTASGVYDSVPHPTALDRYREHTKKRVYRTDVDGTLRWCF